MSLLMIFSHYLIIRLPIAMGLFSNRFQKMSKCGKNISDVLSCALYHFFVVLATFWRHLWSITEKSNSRVEYDVDFLYII